MRVYLEDDWHVSLQDFGVSIKVGPIVFKNCPASILTDSSVNGDSFAWAVLRMDTEDQGQMIWDTDGGPWPPSGSYQPIVFDSMSTGSLEPDVNGFNFEGIDYGVSIGPFIGLNRPEFFYDAVYRGDAGRQRAITESIDGFFRSGTVLMDLTHSNKVLQIKPADGVTTVSKTIVQDQTIINEVTLEMDPVLGAFGKTLIGDGDLTSLVSRWTELKPNAFALGLRVSSVSYNATTDKTIVGVDFAGSLSIYTLPSLFLAIPRTKNIVTGNTITPDWDDPKSVTQYQHSQTIIGYNSGTNSWILNPDNVNSTLSYTVDSQYTTKFFLEGQETELATLKADIVSQGTFPTPDLDPNNYPQDLTGLGYTWDQLAGQVDVDGNVRVIGVVTSLDWATVTPPVIDNIAFGPDDKNVLYQSAKQMSLNYPTDVFNDIVSGTNPPYSNNTQTSVFVNNDPQKDVTWDDGTHFTIKYKEAPPP